MWVRRIYISTGFQPNFSIHRIEMSFHIFLSGNGFIEGSELDGFLREFVTSVNTSECGPEVSEHKGSEILQSFSPTLNRKYAGPKMMILYNTIQKVCGMWSFGKIVIEAVFCKKCIKRASRRICCSHYITFYAIFLQFHRLYAFATLQ